MRMTTRFGCDAVAVLSVSLLGSGMAAAQDVDLQAQVEEFQQRYEAAVAAGDFEAIAAMYVEDMLYSPLPGGLIEDREGIRSFYEQAGLKALDLRSTRTERVGENLILDIGTLTATLPGEAGDMQIEGEYVTLAEVGENGPLIRSLTAFPAR